MDVGADRVGQRELAIGVDRRRDAGFAGAVVEGGNGGGERGNVYRRFKSEGDGFGVAIVGGECQVVSAVGAELHHDVVACRSCNAGLVGYGVELVGNGLGGISKSNVDVHAAEGAIHRDGAGGNG